MPVSKRRTQRKISSFATVLGGAKTNKRKRSLRDEVQIGAAKARVSPPAVNRSLVRSRHDATMYYALKQFWGYDSFRFQQQQIIVQALQGKDCFVIMPTGGGKSLCYQLPAIVTRGVTIVVTPLVSLMQNQVSSLINCKGGGIPAFAFHSSITETQARAVYRELAKVHPTLKLVYVTPEKLVKSDTFMEIIAKLYEDGQLSRIVIDEAHCVSQWGHDFRPDYKKLGVLKTKFPNTPIMALTATATEKVRADVMKQLKMKQGTTSLFKSSFDRPNLSWVVIAKDTKSKQKSLEQLLKICKEQYKAPRCGIIYCLSQKDTEEVSQYLTTNKVQASFYHAGNSAKDRSFVQQNWENGNIRIVVATIAFGMGIDKKDVSNCFKSLFQTVPFPLDLFICYPLFIELTNICYFFILMNRFDSLYISVPQNQSMVITKRLVELAETENHPTVYYCIQQRILDGYDV